MHPDVRGRGYGKALCHSDFGPESARIRNSDRGFFGTCFRHSLFHEKAQLWGQLWGQLIAQEIPPIQRKTGAVSSSIVAICKLLFQNVCRMPLFLKLQTRGWLKEIQAFSGPNIACWTHSDRKQFSKRHPFMEKQLTFKHFDPLQ